MRSNPSVLLVEPERGFDLTYPLALAYLAGHLRRAGVAVRGIDLRIESVSALRRVLRESRFDLIGFRALSTTVREASSVASLARSLQPWATIVAGGPHATLAPTDALERLGADAVIRGDGERPLLALLRGEPHPCGVVRRGESPAGVHVHQNLAELDFPDREVFPVARYYRQGSFATVPRSAMIATRGCFRRCGYCSANALSLGAFRKREPTSVVEEIRHLRSCHGVRGIVFEDDNLLLDPEWARGLFGAIAERAPGTIIDLPNGVNPDLLDEDTIDVLVAAGVRSIAFGLESLCVDNLRAIDRLFDVAHFDRIARYARKRGVVTTGYFLIGLPHDTPASVVSEIASIRRLPLDLAHVSVFRRLPGQPLHTGESTMSEATLRALRTAFYASFYARPARAAASMARSGGIRGAGRLVWRAVQWLRG